VNMRGSLVIAFVVALFSAVLVPLAADEPLDLSVAPLMLPGVRAQQISSFDKSGGNADGDSRWGFTRYDKVTKFLTLFEATGIGRVVRFWMTGWKDPSDVILRYSPVGEKRLPVASLFSSGDDAGRAPLVGDRLSSSGGYFSYVPWDFDGYFSLQTPRMVPPFYYQIGYRNYVDAEARNRSLAGFVPSGKTTKTVGSIRSLGSGATQQVLQADGSGLIESLLVTMPAALAAHGGKLAGSPLSACWIVIYFDGERVASIEVPLTGFFAGTALGETVNSVPVTVSAVDGRLKLENRFPMPFARSFKVTLENRGADALESLELSVTWVADPAVSRLLSTNILGRLRAVARNSGALVMGQDAVLLDVAGKAGKIVGLVLESVGTKLDRAILEGDERIFLDGSRSPQIHGTGTEDFFNGGWYYDQGTFTRELSGNPAHHVDDPGDHTFQYRFMLSDAIPFNQSALIKMEHGRINDEAGSFLSTVFWYEAEKSMMRLSDKFIPSDALDAASHSFSAEGSKLQELTAPWLGSGRKETETRIGIVSGASVFSASIDPENDGLLLRRTIDYALANQNARVFIDGQDAGVWLSPGPGSAPGALLADVEFLVPPGFTRGKSRINVRFEPDGLWSAFEYQIFCLSD